MLLNIILKRINFNHESKFKLIIYKICYYMSNKKKVSIWYLYYFFSMSSPSIVYQLIVLNDIFTFNYIYFFNFFLIPFEIDKIIFIFK